VVGDGTHVARLALSPAGGAHGFADGLTVAATATLSGGGSITGDVTSAGTVSPGLAAGDAGLIAIAGSYHQSAAGTLAADVGAGAAGSGFDAVRVSGGATLDGTLDVQLRRGSLPVVGQQFELLIA